MKNTEKKKIVVKDNALIQKSKFLEMPLSEMRALAYLSSLIDRIDENAPTQYTYVFKKAEFCRMVGIEEYNSGNYNHLKNTLKNMLERIIEIEDEKKWQAFHIISKVECDYSSEEVLVTFHQDIIPYLFNLKKNYTSYQLENILHLRSKNSFRLYEFLTSFHRDKVVIYISKLKELFSVNYKRPIDLENYCIKPAVKEINEKTDIVVSYTKIKTQRAVTSIEFNVKYLRTIDKEQSDNGVVYKIVHIANNGIIENFTATSVYEVQAIIDENRLENGKTGINKTIGESVENVTSEFQLY